MLFDKNPKHDHSHMFRHLAVEISLEDRQERLETHTHAHCKPLAASWPDHLSVLLSECGVGLSSCKLSAGQSSAIILLASLKVVTVYWYHDWRPPVQQVQV